MLPHSYQEELSLLIVDDHQMVREGLRSMLDVKGIHIVGEANSGRTAIDQIRALDPDVVLMDIRMPRLDGITTLEHIRGTDGQMTNVPIIALSSEALVLPNRPHLLECFDACLVKPID